MSYHPVMGIGALGAQEMQNPLPVGRYQIDVFGDNRQKMMIWAKQPNVVVESSTTVHPDPQNAWQLVTGWFQSEEDLDNDPNTYDEYVFSVKQPVEWDATTFGFPDIVPANQPIKPTSPGSAKSPATSSSSSKSPPKSSLPQSDNTVLYGVIAFAVVGAGVLLAMRSKKAAA